MAKGRLRAALIVGAILAPTLSLAQSVPASAADDPWIDTSDRAAVLDAYIAEFDRIEPAIDHDGDVNSCTPGSTSQAFRDSVVQRLNWYRQMAGLATVTERSAYSTAAQETSTMMSAEGSLSHAPGAEWACHTSSGATTAGRSNLALGINGIGAIDAYIQDPGEHNLSAGHRRTMLYPQLREIGTGDVAAGDDHFAANSLHIFDDNVWGIRPDVREERDFVAWPPAGYVPPATVWGRWSFSLNGADFGTATITVTNSLGPVDVSILDRVQSADPNARIAPEPSIVWAVNGDPDSSLLAAPTDGDECFAIAVGGVAIGGVVQPDYEYQTCVIDPEHTPEEGDRSPELFIPASVGCEGTEFAAWTAPCWNRGSSLGRFIDVVADWQVEPVRWLVGNGITTGISATKFDPAGSLTRGQAATLIWRLVGSPAAPDDAPTFFDVAPSAYYNEAVGWLAGYGITTGTGSGQFSPDAHATRAEFVTLLWRLVDQPVVDDDLVFTDVTASWQVSSVRWAGIAGVTTGTSTSSFSPNATITRGQAAALLARFADSISR
jgi:uncharacterized protein YkwD